MKLITKLVATVVCASIVVPAFAGTATAPKKPAAKTVVTHKMGGKMAGHHKMGKMTSHKMTGKPKAKTGGAAKKTM